MEASLLFSGKTGYCITLCLLLKASWRVKFYFEHSFDIGKKQYRHCFACVQFKEFQDDTPFRNPLSVFYAKVFKLPGAATFMAVQRIQSRFIAINKKHQNFDLLIVCPLLPKTFI